MVNEIITKFALQNAIKHGKASSQNIIGKVLGANPEYRNKSNEIIKLIDTIVEKVNKMSNEEQTIELLRIAPELLEQKPKRTSLPELDVNGKVIMRFEPSPSGPLHIGHSYVLSLNSEYCKMYKGKLILRIADTNPNNIYEPAYDMIVNDARWITQNNIQEVLIQSDRINIYYNYALKLIEAGQAYICACDPEEFKELLSKSIACPCRDLPPEEQAKRWHNMFTDKPGSAVMRIKTDLNHKNPAIRDWPAMRIIEQDHPRQGSKYRVWPLMNLSVAIDDIEYGITHIVRAKEHADNAKRQEYIYNFFNKPIPQTIFVGRINFIDIEVSSTKTRERIEKGEFNGWEDIRLPFLKPLLKRGYQPQSLIRYAIEVGTSATDKKVSKQEFFKSINAFNKEILEPITDRYFFIEDPVEIHVENAPCLGVELDLHPDHRKGGRKFNTSEDFLIPRADFKKIKENEIYRLMGCLNFRKENNKFVYVSTEHNKEYQIMHWLPKQSNVPVEVLMPDNTKKKGLAEPLVGKLKKCSVVQFVRLGFCHLEQDNLFWFGHT